MCHTHAHPPTVAARTKNKLSRTARTCLRPLAQATDDKVFVFGGRNTFVLNDLYMLDVHTLVWTAVKTLTSVPTMHG